MQNKSLALTNLPRVKYFDGNYESQQNGIQSATFDVASGSPNPGNMKDPTNWSYDIVDAIHWKGSFFWTYTYQGYHTIEWRGPQPWGGNNYAEFLMPSWDRSNVYNAALTRLNDKIRGGLDISIALAEAKTTARMVRALGNVIAHARNFRSFGSTKDLANGWLQWQYGWKPLCNDVFAVADESIRIVLNKLQSVRARVTYPIKVSGLATRMIVEGGYDIPINRDGSGKQSCTFSVSYYPKEFELARWTSLNPVSIAWELIPYSFVIDWFVDVGSYLRNLESALLYNNVFNSGYVSELFAYDGTETVVQPNSYEVGIYTRFYTNTARRRRERRFRRTRLLSYPLPRAPSISADLNSARLFSAAALLRQLLK